MTRERRGRIRPDIAMTKPLITASCAALAALTLSACEFRREGGAQPDPEPTETPAIPGEEGSAADPEATQTPGTSIIREDIRPVDVPEEPVEPFAITVPFPEGGNEIEGAALSALLEVLQSDALDEGWPLVLGGHTDSSGNDSANLRASRARAEAVAAWLVERGVDDDRISVIAFGEQNPAAPNANPDGTPNEQGRASNRRVEIEIAPPRRAQPVQTDEDAS